jgi:hypothetical protein
MLAYRNPGVSVWAPLLACAYPVFETLFTIVRRVWARSHPGEPDSEHLHSLVKRGIALRLFPNLRADLRNASVSPFLWVIAVVPAACAVRFAHWTSALLVCSLLSFMLYLAFYWYVATTSRKHASAKLAAGLIAALDDEEVMPARRIS